MTDYTVRRDYWDRPIVGKPGAPPITTWEEKRNSKKTWWTTPEGKGYGRASGAGKGLDTKEGLIDWAACQAAVGILLDSSARSQIATLVNEYGDPWNAESDDKFTPKDRLKQAVEQARNTAGQHTASSAGTEMHKLGELHNKGVTPRIVQPHLTDLFDHYKQAVEPFEFLAQELLIVNDTLELCGSVDYLMRVPAGARTPDGTVWDDPMVVVGDLKTGRWDARYPMSVTCQLAAYGTGLRYEQDANVRLPLHENVNTEWGLLVHFPIMSRDPRVRFYWVDLRLGLRAALLGRQVEEMRSVFKRKDAELVELGFVS